MRTGRRRTTPALGRTLRESEDRIRGEMASAIAASEHRILGRVDEAISATEARLEARLGARVDASAAETRRHMDVVAEDLKAKIASKLGSSPRLSAAEPPTRARSG